MTRRIRKPIVAQSLLLMLAWLVPLAAGDDGKSYVNVDQHGLALQGYDPVAYFTLDKAVKGDAAIRSTHRGATYRFADAGHKAAFDADPDRYAPQFGGFCAFAVSRGYTAKIDPEAFQIVAGRLLLQYNAGVREKFSQDLHANVEKADANWPGLVEKHGK